MDGNLHAKVAHAKAGATKNGRKRADFQMSQHVVSVESSSLLRFIA